jgi:hypothetical protein
MTGMTAITGNNNFRNTSMLCAAALTVIVLLYPFLFGWPANILSWDVFGYYLYLPLGFIYQDISLQDPDVIHSIIAKYNSTETFYQMYLLENGNWVMKYSMGMAIFYLPFFLLGHGIALISGFPADGFSEPYQWCMIAGNMFYSILAIWLLLKVLLHFFNQNLTALLLVFIILGTNWLMTAMGSMMMPHIPLFTALCGVILLTIRWAEHPSKKRAFLLGALIGLMTIARPTEALVAMIPVFWVATPVTWFKKFKTLAAEKHILFIMAGGILVLLPQLLYWKVITGEFLYKSYNNPQEGLDFLYPHTIDFLFSFRKGWFIYTPLMIIGILGFIGIWKYHKDKLLPLGFFAGLSIYIASSWSTWWYAASFSQRPMVQILPVMAISLGYGIRYARRNGAFFRYSVIVLCFLFTVLNLFQTWQYHKGIIHPERMTRQYYAAVFLKTEIPADAENLLLVNRNIAHPHKHTITSDYTEYKNWTGCNNYIEAPPEITVDGKCCLPITASGEYSGYLDIPFHDITPVDHAWIEISADVKLNSVQDAETILLVCHFMHKEKPYTYQAFPLSALIDDTLKTEQWHSVRVTYLTPEIRRKSDKFRVIFWNRQKGSALVSNLIVKSWIKK